ncbi:hypothetical protein THAOC_00263, partial [Thalassiosira oceanica]
ATRGPWAAPRAAAPRERSRRASTSHTQPAACGIQDSAMPKPQKNDLRSYWGNKGASASSSTNAGAPPPSIPGSAPPARARAGALTDDGASLVDSAAAARSSARSSARPGASTPHGSALARTASTSASSSRNMPASNERIEPMFEVESEFGHELLVLRWVIGR